MSEQRPDVPREILTERLRLHQYREEDAELVFEAIEESRAELERWMPWASFIRDAQQLRDDMPRSLEAWDRGEDYGYTIRRREDDRLLGSINYQDPNWAIPRFDLGYWMRTSETGKGYVSEAVRGLVRVAFGRLDATRVQIACDENNTRSVRVAEACGFQYEGRMRHDHRMPNDELISGVYYSLIDTDEAVRRLLEQPEAT
jgi:RimJ/RimL family protein N-acetyltransferase